VSAAHTAAPVDGRRRPGRLADQPIRVKLALLLVAPVAVMLLLAGLIAYGAQSAASGAEQARRLVALSLVAGQLAGQVQQERTTAALALAKTADDATLEVFQQQTLRSDAVATLFSRSTGDVQVPVGLRPVLQRITEQVDGLPLLREQVRSGRDATTSVIVFRYRSLIADLIAYRAAMSQLGVDAATADSLRAAATLSQAIEGLGLLQVGALPPLSAGSLSAAEQQQVVANDASFTQSLEAFRQLAPPRWRAQLSAQASSKDIVAGERLQALIVSTQPNTPLDLDTKPARFVSAVAARMAQLHALEYDVDAQLVQDVTAQRDREQRQIAVLGGGVLVALLVVGAFAWSMTRSLTRPLRELHDGATALATTTLPYLVEKLTNGNLDETAAAALVDEHALVVHGSDEVGTVAAAFNDVAAVASQLAGQQAVLRGLNYQIVRSLANRLRAVVNQVTASLDDLERNEENPARLELLFAADQQVTSTRRFVNNLLVISGGKLPQSVDEPISVPDVVKAAISWAEGASTRVRDTRVGADCLIRAHAVDPIVHTLTELLVNALYFAPPETMVTVSSARVGDLLYLHISDEGIGLPPEKLAEVEGNLAAFDLAAASRHMGVPVIGLLAADLGLRVTFRPREARGTSVEVVIPANLLIDTPQRNVAITDGPERPAIALPADPAAPVLPGPAFSAPPAAVAAPTQEMWPVAGRPAPGIEPATAQLPIYDVLVQENPYFRGQHSSEPGPTLPAAWQAGHNAADSVHRETEALATEGSDRSTSSGLPVRRPGQFVIPPTSSTPAAIPAQRDRAATRAGMAALSRTARKARPALPQQIG
jgi:signal transduction histidine kinase